MSIKENIGIGPKRLKVMSRTVRILLEELSAAITKLKASRAGPNADGLSSLEVPLDDLHSDEHTMFVLTYLKRTKRKWFLETGNIGMSKLGRTLKYVLQIQLFDTCFKSESKIDIASFPKKGDLEKDWNECVSDATTASAKRKASQIDEEEKAASLEVLCTRQPYTKMKPKSQVRVASQFASAITAASSDYDDKKALIVDIYERVLGEKPIDLPPPKLLTDMISRNEKQVAMTTLLRTKNRKLTADLKRLRLTKQYSLQKVIALQKKVSNCFYILL